MKLQASAVLGLILLIVIVAAVYFVYTSFKFPPNHLPPSDYHPPQPTYSNDVISLEDIKISGAKLYPGMEFSLSFFLKNNGERKVKNLMVNFFSPSFEESVLSLQNLTCEDSTPSHTRCSWDELESLSSKYVELRLRAGREESTSPVPYTLRYLVRYDYDTFRTAEVPIIDGTTVTEPKRGFSLSEPDYSPVQVDVRLEGEKDYAIQGRPFMLTITLTDVGTMGKRSTATIDAIEIKFPSQYISQEGYCDLKCGNDRCSVSEKFVLSKKEPLIFRCQLIPKKLKGVWQFIAHVTVSANFTYGFEEEEKIVVLPYTVV